MEYNQIYNTDCLAGLQALPDNSIDCCATSPPYFGLRDYGITGQIGLEETPDKYVERLVGIFNEVFRVLKPSGTLWLNIGDSYAGSGKGGGGKHVYLDLGQTRNNAKTWDGIKAKDLIGIPWLLAFELRRAGWYLRQDIIWHKPNAMPESVKDRCGKSHEHIFLLSKSPRYYFDKDAIKQPAKTKEKIGYTYQVGGKKRTGLNQNDPALRKNTNRSYTPTDMVNKRDVWSVNTKPSKEAHFAVFPQELITDCIKAGCPKGGVVLDPFMGSGTTAIVARRLGRNYLGFELNPEYMGIIEKRLNENIGF